MRTLPDRYSGAGINRSCPELVGVGEHEPGEGLAGVVLAAAEQPGDLVEADLAVGVQADRDGVGRGVGAQARGAGGDDAPAHDRGLAGGAGGGVEVLQRVHGGGVRVEFGTRPGAGRCGPGGPRR